MMVILVIVIAAIVAGLYLGLPYVAARRRRKDLERRGRIKSSPPPLDPS